jgi:hypothetical protein
MHGSHCVRLPRIMLLLLYIVPLNARERVPGGHKTRNKNENRIRTPNSIVFECRGSARSVLFMNSIIRAVHRRTRGIPAHIYIFTRTRVLTVASSCVCVHSDYFFVRFTRVSSGRRSLSPKIAFENELDVVRNSSR